MLNNAITKIQTWTSSVGFKLSIEKTQAIMFYKNIRWKQNQEINLFIGNNQIMFKDTVKFLGLIFDTHLNWKAHVAYIKTKCNSTFNLMLKLSHTTWGARRQIMLMLYKALVLSKIDYGSPIYGAASEATLKSLDSIHTRGLRLCSGAFKSSPNSSVLCESGEPPLSLHRNLVIMRSALKVLSTDSPTKKLFQIPDIFINNHVPPFPIRANRLFEATNINITLHPPPAFPPPWIIKKVKICSQLYYLSKKYNTTPSHHRQYALEHIQRKGHHHAIFTDGSKSSEGVGSAAVSSLQTSKFSLPNEASVFTSEVTAILLAVEIIKSSNEQENQKFVIYSDSRSAIEALRNYTHKNPLILKIRNMLHKLYSRGVSIEICWIPAHVGICGNEKADLAAKSAQNSPKYDVKLPANDYINTIKLNLKTQWQNGWNNEPDTNKLKQIKPSVHLWDSSLQNERKTEVILTRLRIGHTKLTHGFLMKTPHGEIPVCRTCNSFLTVKHILCECKLYDRVRSLCFGRKSLKEILGNSDTFSISSVLTFLRNSGLIDKI